MRLGLTAKFLVGSAGVGGIYGYYSVKKGKKKALVPPTGPDYVLEKHPDVKSSYSSVFAEEKSNLRLTLFQYRTCPFCSKVRVFLDYYGLSHDIVEVNPVLRKELKWSIYKKVPLLIASGGGVHQQLNDSSMIVSVLYSHLVDPKKSVSELASFYPSLKMSDDDGNEKYVVMNKYNVMHGALSSQLSENAIREEKKWRVWSDDVLVHMLSPNVYRTPSEALQTFQWFSKVGRWDDLFESWEKTLVIYVGAAAMYLIGKNLKRRHNLKNNVRESLYDACNVWLKELKSHKSVFHGGERPDLADLTVYATLTSIEGCDAFRDLLNNTKIGGWYTKMSEVVALNDGRKYLSHN